MLPVVAKWVLIGRWKPASIRAWSPSYLRFWVVKTLVRSSPMVLFTGTPLFTLYLRALGAQVGRDVVYLSRQVPVCTDLFSIGDRTLVRKDAVIACYRAHAGRVEIGGVSIGADAFVGESTVLDVRTSIGDGASLAHVGVVVDEQRGGELLDVRDVVPGPRLMGGPRAKSPSSPVARAGSGARWRCPWPTGAARSSSTTK